ncbi:hypothetical protein PQU92_08215 [Asticcacaulis sp. BYS171W]|uniref:Uncharacterized protein n=1 Tax=Asticcacaulis aquaticus TaxID=2984212 RepID=A0ABT5HTG1_9CAUL|nr:hypothetical protein [Asticcacaulis aquaticus]MDC7683258.1 hypothetical protein [Asticcacaulis aquaticus]
MSWKTETSLADLDAEAQIEVTCKDPECDHMRYELAGDLRQRKGFARLYLDEVEARLTCGSRGCGHAVRLQIMLDLHEEGFVAGMP